MGNSEKLIVALTRHVATPEGADHFGQPIGSVIVPDLPIGTELISHKKFPNWKKVGKNKWVTPKGSKAHDAAMQSQVDQGTWDVKHPKTKIDPFAVARAERLRRENFPQGTILYSSSTGKPLWRKFRMFKVTGLDRGPGVWSRVYGKEDEYVQIGTAQDDMILAWLDAGSLVEKP